MQSVMKADQITFFRVPDSVDTFRCLVYSIGPSVVGEVALDVTILLVLQLFHYVNTRGFLRIPLMCRKWDTCRHLITPRATTATTRYRIE